MAEENANQSRGGFTTREALFYHETIRPGKLEIVATKPMTSQRDLSLAYSPGVAAPVEAIAAGGLKRFETDSLTIDLPVRTDLALWRDRGTWRGIVQGHQGDLPAVLTELTGQWTHLRMPQRNRAALPPKAARSSRKGNSE